MTNVEYSEQFKKNIKKLKDAKLKDTIKKQITKIVEYPTIGKPMRYDRKETRELYISPYRLVYAYNKKTDELIFLGIYHKDEQ